MTIDFPLILVILVFGSGGIWLVDALFMAPRRRSVREALQAQYPGWSRDGSKDAAAYQAKVRATAAEPTLVEYSRSFFPVVVVVVVLRSFLG